MFFSDATNDAIYSNDVNKYNFYEKSGRSKYERRTITGNVTGCSKCHGYCQYEGHPGFLTEKQIKEHSCVQKQCLYFIPKPPKEQRAKKDNHTVIFNIIQDSISQYEGVKILHIKNSEKNICQAYYIAITNEYNFNDCISKIKSTYNIDLAFVQLNYDFDVCAELLCRT